MERAGSFIVDDAFPAAGARSGLASWYTPGLSDALGDRLLMFDNSTASPLELLRFKREFSSAPAFEAAVRDRVQQLNGFSHPSVGRVRAVEWLEAGSALALVSNQTAGRRLSELLHEARGPTFAVELIRQLTPALAALHQQDESVAHGALTPDRIIVTPEGRLVIVEHVLGSALQTLQLPAHRLRSELGLAVTPADDNATLDQRADLRQLGLVALSLVAGRRVAPAEYPNGIAELLETLAERYGHGSLASLRLRWWLEHALQLDGRTFSSTSEASDALAELPEDFDMPLYALPKPDPADPQPGDQALTVVPDPEASPALLEHAPQFAAETPSEPPAPSGPVRSWQGESKRWLVAALAGVALVEAIVIGTLIYQRRAARAAPAATPPLVLLESEIANLQVMVDGKKSPTPVMLNVTPGMKSIRILKPDDAAGAATGGPVDVAALAAGTGQVEITSEPAGARVTIDGTRRGVTPLTVPLPAGSHAILVSDGTTNVSRAVTVAAGTRSTVMAAMAPAGAVAGWITFTTPFELEVLEGGNLIGTTNTAKLMLTAGRHELDLRNTALGFSNKVTVDIQAGRTLTNTVVAPNGKLSVNALPWATVSLDGRELGTTPIANLDVPLGTHELVFRHPQLGERRQSVVVTAKAPVRIVQDLRK